MKAAIKTGVLGTTISFSETVPAPLLEPRDKDSVLVRVHAGAINPIDYKLPRFASGTVVGQDFCGTIERVHSDDTHTSSSAFKVGDLVFGKAKGSLAEFTLASTKEIAKAPHGWKATDCASIPTAYWSALQSLRRGKILPEETSSSSSSSSSSSFSKSKSVLVIGASGGCGLAGVQLCAGMTGVSRIVAICSERNESFVREHGATEVVNYTDEEKLRSFLEDNKGKFDCVYDTATYSGGRADYWGNSTIGLLKRDDSDGKIVGEYTALNGSPSKWVRAVSGLQKEHETLIMMDAKGPDLELVVQLMETAKAKPFTKVFSFDEKGIRDGFELLKSRRAKGKIVFDILAAAASTSCK